jgi:hypothetical protein
MARSVRPLHGMPSPVLFPMVLLGVLALPLVASAQGVVPLKVQVIYAANETGGVDSRLGTLAAELQKTFRYSKYELLDSPQGSAPLNQGWRTALPGDRVLEITPTAISDGEYTIAIRVQAAGGQALVNTQIKLKAGRSVLVGGPTHQKGVLIIAITAD